MKSKSLLPVCLAFALLLTACSDKSATYALVEVPKERRSESSDKATTQRIKVIEREAFTTERIEDADLASGATVISQDGVNGESEVTYEIKLINGKEVSRTAISERIITKAVPQIILVGTAERDGDAASIRTEPEPKPEVSSDHSTSHEETPPPEVSESTESASVSDSSDILVIPDWSAAPSESSEPSSDAPISDEAPPHEEDAEQTPASAEPAVSSDSGE